ncbi:MAG: sensor histidine kinase [Planctomycetia bacterium]|nr:sensor histidine kinase [Planctomycetia bacterium]
MSQDSGAWLVVRSPSSTQATCEPVALPVPRQACLGLARAVLADDDDEVRWLAAAGGDDVVRRWLAGARPGAGEAFRASRPERRPAPSLLDVFARDFAVGSAPGESGPVAEASAEATLLAEAVGRMVSHRALSGRFAESVHAARLEVARELAYGAGHEINNPLANIATRAQALLLEERDAERRRRLATIVDQSFRARDMIGGLMLFARPPKPRPEATGIGEMLGSVVQALGSLAEARGVRLNCRTTAPTLEACVDRVQIADALRAIATNAIEAASVGGEVVLDAVAAPSGDWCEITVADDGGGMDEATVRRAFDPFFSGREAGRGAGLGLAKAWRFVEASGGSVEIASRPGVGTTVTVVLPAVAARRVCPAFPV